MVKFIAIAKSHPLTTGPFLQNMLQYLPINERFRASAISKDWNSVCQKRATFSTGFFECVLKGSEVFIRYDKCDSGDNDDVSLESIHPSKRSFILSLCTELVYHEHDDSLERAILPKLPNVISINFGSSVTEIHVETLRLMCENVNEITLTQSFPSLDISELKDCFQGLHQIHMDNVHGFDLLQLGSCPKLKVICCDPKISLNQPLFSNIDVLFINLISPIDTNYYASLPKNLGSVKTLIFHLHVYRGNLSLEDIDVQEDIENLKYWMDGLVQACPNVEKVYAVEEGVQELEVGDDDSITVQYTRIDVPTCEYVENEDEIENIYHSFCK